MIITDPKKRGERSAEKQSLVLAFLKQETYSDLENLMLLLHYRDRSTLYRLLKKMSTKGIIEKFEYGFRDIKIKICFRF